MFCIIMFILVLKEVVSGKNPSYWNNSRYLQPKWTKVSGEMYYKSSTVTSAKAVFTFNHGGILCCVLLSGGKTQTVKRELDKRIWHILTDVDNVDVNIRRDFPVNRSLFVYTSGCIYPQVVAIMRWMKTRWHFSIASFVPTRLLFWENCLNQSIAAVVT